MGFLDAGYEVKEAIDYDIEKVKIYESIFGRSIVKCEDVCLLNSEEIKDADIITGVIRLSGLHIMEQKNRAEYDSVNKWMVNLVRVKRPKAFVLQTAGIRTNEIRKVWDCYVNMGYHMCYKILDEKGSIDTACSKIPLGCSTAEKIEENIDAGCARDEWDVLI